MYIFKEMKIKEIIQIGAEINDRSIQDLKHFPVWGKPLKIYYGNPYLSLLSAQVTSYTVADA